MILDVKDLGINFGGLRAVSDFNLQIDDGQLVGLIGPNGAGKTTIFNLLTGVYKPTEGQIIFNSKNINGKKPYQIAKAGIGRTFQNIRLFKELSVLDNAKIGLHNRYPYSLASALFKGPRYFQDEKQMNQKAEELLAIFGLNHYKHHKAKSLPYGKQRELEIVRALAMDPKLLLLDEPAAGMNPQETESLMNTIKKIQETYNVAILLIEHDMQLVMGICEKITVLNYGVVLAEGTPSEIQNNKEVIKAYLGD